MVDDYGLKLLRWVRERGVRQKLLIEKGSCVGWGRGEHGKGKEKRERAGPLLGFNGFNGLRIFPEL